MSTLKQDALRNDDSTDTPPPYENLKPLKLRDILPSPPSSEADSLEREHESCRYTGPPPGGHRDDGRTMAPVLEESIVEGTSQKQPGPTHRISLSQVTEETPYNHESVTYNRKRNGSYSLLRGEQSLPSQISFGHQLLPDVSDTSSDLHGQRRERGIHTESEAYADAVIHSRSDSISRSATDADQHDTLTKSLLSTPAPRNLRENQESKKSHKLTVDTLVRGTPATTIISPQPRPATHRALSTPANIKSPDPTPSHYSRQSTVKSRSVSKSDGFHGRGPQVPNGSISSPMTSVPLPPLSLPTYLQLELSSHRPSQLYIDRSSTSEFPYESSRVKIERLLNFLLLPHQLEAVLWFGTLACLDSWLYTFTILPLRLLKALYILLQCWIRNFVSEMQSLFAYVYSGTQRVWRRRTRGDSAMADAVSSKNANSKHVPERNSRRQRGVRHHRRSKSVPSLLLPDDKADILKSLLIIFTTLILLRLDASRMYHWVRGQAAIKLYVIYNVLEVGDRLLSAIGQDVLECLFSQEALERKPDGHSKILRPFWLFILALAYTVTHATALFYQVVTLNVAVNSYSNALITLLMSNQFVEIKSTVFKKFEKENLFQLTCADIVERFQLWHMLLIIAARNIVETGGLSWGSAVIPSPPARNVTAASNGSNVPNSVIPPWSASSILPSSFTILPSVLSSLSSYVPVVGHILGPFIIVLGSEMLIDWLKHAYINKFNNTRPVIYGRFLDILAKDYYTNAFGDQNLTKRLGLPVIPLSCLMIRASVQTYQMFVAAWLPPSSSSSATLASIHEQYSASRASQPTSTAAAVVRRVDELLYSIPSTIVDSAIAPYFTTILIALLSYLVLLICKLILGMVLLAFARSRYRSMREKERNPGHYVEGGRRVGGWGVVEVDEDKRRWIYDDDPTALRALKERDAKESLRREAERAKGGNIEGLDKVKRYEMVAKRIW